MGTQFQRAAVVLDPELKSPAAQAFEAGLRTRLVGQDRAIGSLTALYQLFQAGMNDPRRPIGTMLLLGPTGSGKTRTVEAAAEILFGDPNALVKIDCAEIQHSHEIAKLIGSPPGYLGHRETSPLLTQESLDKHHTERDPFTLVLFDEIEKASDALWQLLLGILDRASLTLGDNRRVDFSRTMIFLTSNLGAREMNKLISGTLGFAPAVPQLAQNGALDEKIYRTALDAARRTFLPEFINRIDKVVVFRNLSEQNLRRILDLELCAIQRRIYEGPGPYFKLTISEQAGEFLLAEGTDQRYGARHLKRAIERFIVHPIANLAATGQVSTGSILMADIGQDPAKLIFYRQDGAAMNLIFSEVAKAKVAGADFCRLAA